MCSNKYFMCRYIGIVCMCVCACEGTYVYMCAYVYMYIYMCVHMCFCMCMYVWDMYECVHACMYAYACMSKYVYTHGSYKPTILQQPSQATVHHEFNCLYLHSLWCGPEASVLRISAASSTISVYLVCLWNFRESQATIQLVTGTILL